MIRFHNTLSGREEEFQPLDPGEVRVYTCGPTVYDLPHIGNFRAYVFEDLLLRFLRYSGFKTVQVMNLTDVDDKTIRGARASGVSLREYTEPFVRAFFSGLALLRIRPADHYPRATEHIPEMVAIIKGLLDKGVAYRKDGSIYFSIEKFPAYGRLSGINPDDLRITSRIGARLESDEYEKDSARDFALWKAPREGEPSWETDIGPGRPGWHIECSAMSSKYLGPSFDIHCGGVDNIFPHHENEIAQSEAYFEKPFVRYWLHCHHLVVDGEKMAKSKGNFYTLRDLVEARGVDPSALRMFLVGTHYRKVLNFTLESLEQSAAALKRIKDFVYELENRIFPAAKTDASLDLIACAERTFREGMEDDLNVSAALTGLFDLIRKANPLIQGKKIGLNEAKRLLDFVYRVDEVLAVLPERRDLEISDDLRAKIEERERARKSRDWAAADRLRRELLENGVVLEDTKDGVRWKIEKKTGSN
ncbi:MAG: cysteine--tRNA ligase [Candidatus Aminicenantes bacterium]|nr:cysteine--tRNA ligase [Candidatus Aminicenantes bacterium]